MVVARTRYRLPDEPSPSGFSQYTVDPIWPLLALMLTSNLIGLAWFVFNAVAMGSAGRAREMAYAAFSIVGCMVLFTLIEFLRQTGVLTGSAPRYAAISIIALKLVAGYAICLSQQRSFELWRHFGGIARNALPMLVIAYLGSRAIARIDGIPPLIAIAIR